MSVMQKGEDLKKAMEWIFEEIKSGTKKSKVELINEASVKFNIKPIDEEFLERFYNENYKDSDR
jgi:hypothetical protein